MGVSPRGGWRREPGTVCTGQNQIVLPLQCEMKAAQEINQRWRPINLWAMQKWPALRWVFLQMGKAHKSIINALFCIKHIPSSSWNFHRLPIHCFLRGLLFLTILTISELLKREDVNLPLSWRLVLERPLGWRSPLRTGRLEWGIIWPGGEIIIRFVRIIFCADNSSLNLIIIWPRGEIIIRFVKVIIIFQSEQGKKSSQ